jgi:outer membrane protein TolC
MRLREALRRSGALSSVLFSILSHTVIARSAGGETPPSSTEPELAGKVDRASLERIAVARDPQLKAAAHRIRSIAAQGASEGSIPPPDFMAQVWQVPLSHPLNFADAGMIMLGLSQSFPAIGSLSSKEEARKHEARAEAAMLAGATLDLVRQVDHAYVDYVSAVARRRIHADHQKVLERMNDLARARQSTGGSLLDVAQAEAELGRLAAELGAEAVIVETARARLNGLLARDPGASLGEPAEEPPATVALPVKELVARAEAARPELKAAEEKREAALAQARSARREATIPSFSIAALYFAPVGPMPVHGWGTNFSMSLPWLWGSRSSAADAQQEAALAEQEASASARLRARTEVATMVGTAREQEQRYGVLSARALPAMRRALEAAQAGYASNRVPLTSVLGTERAVVDIELEVILARAALEHALVDLDWASGGRLPRQPISRAQGDSHGH